MKQQVYIAQYGGYEESYVLGVYQTQKKALTALRRRFGKNKIYDMRPASQESDHIYVGNIKGHVKAFCMVNWVTIERQEVK